MSMSRKHQDIGYMGRNRYDSEDLFFSLSSLFFLLLICFRIGCYVDIFIHKRCGNGWLLSTICGDSTGRICSLKHFLTYFFSSVSSSFKVQSADSVWGQFFLDPGGKSCHVLYITGQLLREIVSSCSCGVIPDRLSLRVCRLSPHHIIEASDTDHEEFILSYS